LVVYLIVNMINGKCYVGQTRKTIKQRWQRHRWCYTVSNGKHPIALAMRKYGKESFEIVELEICKTQQELDDREIYWARALDTFSPNGYNLKAGKGRGTVSPEVCRKIAISNLGRKASQETIQRLRDSHLGYKRSPEAVAAQSARMKGIAPSEATRLGASLKCAKTYRLCSPQGEVVEITNLKRFCRDKGYHYPKMNEAANGKRLYRGWGVSYGFGENHLGKLLMMVRTELM
jgi:group I intron endonuclease